MRHKTLTGVDGRGAGPTAACQQIVGALQEQAAEHTCKQRSRSFTCVTAHLRFSFLLNNESLGGFTQNDTLDERKLLVSGFFSGAATPNEVLA